jgi:hypothetical protein
MAKKPLILSGSMQRVTLANKQPSVALKSLAETEAEKQAAMDLEEKAARESVAKSEGVILAGPGMEKPIEERSPASFVEDMLKHGRTPKDILAVAAAIRGGSWRPKVKLILEAKGILPPPEPKPKKEKGPSLGLEAPAPAPKDKKEFVQDGYWVAPVKEEKKDEDKAGV